jgi:hypothetical protein
MDILHDQTLQLVLLLAVICALADWVTATLAAVRTHTFAVTYVDEWAHSHLLGKVFPIVALALAAAAINASLAAFPTADSTLRTTMSASAGAAWIASLAALATYAASTLAALTNTLPLIANPPTPISIAGTLAAPPVSVMGDLSAPDPTAAAAPDTTS